MNQTYLVQILFIFDFNVKFISIIVESSIGSVGSPERPSPKVVIRLLHLSQKRKELQLSFSLN